MTGSRGCDNGPMLPSAWFADRSQRGKVRLTGPQRAWFLHQVLSQSFEDISAGEAREAAMLTAHGRMVGFLEVLATEDALLAHFEPELREVLPEALGRYVFATRVEIADVTDTMGLLLVGGSGWEKEARARGAHVHPTLSLGTPAGYLWTEREALQGLVAALAARGFVSVPEEQLESVRVANAVPRWGREMNSRTLPQEVGIDGRAVHYDKGCYVGQEAMAKIHFRGRVNRRLARLETTGELRAGDELTFAGERVGSVTSVADAAALAILRRTVERGAVVAAGAAEATVVD